MSRSEEEEVRMKKLLPYFLLLLPLWIPLSGGLLCGVVYGVSSGFGLPYMVDQIFPKIFASMTWRLMIFRPINSLFTLRGCLRFF